MKTTSMTFASPTRRSAVAGYAAAVALVALGFASNADARDNVTFSVDVGLPGVVVGASNAYPVYTPPQPVYVQTQPVYVQPRPIYVQPRPIYVQPAPVYYQPVPVYYRQQPVYAVPQLIYYGRPHEGKHGHHKKHGWKHQENHNQGYQGHGQQNQGYAPVYYQR